MEITVSSKGQIVIPYRLRKKYDLQQGTKLQVIEEEDSIKLIPPVKLRDLCGIWKLDMESLDRQLSEEREHWR